MIDDFSESDASILLYVERLGNTESLECKNRYALIERQALNCSITFDDANLQITLRGDMKLLLYETSRNSTSFSCPETDLMKKQIQTNASETTQCFNIHT